MRSRPERIAAIGIVLVGVLLLMAQMIRHWNFARKLERVHSGMSELEVMTILGNPNEKGTVDVFGSGGKQVISWTYKRGNWLYSVDYDYTGPAGLPEVYRTRQTHQNWYWNWPSWWPWQRPKAKA
ncbi:hypothetical protein GC207_13895 [bacterium]|nr:hypothetical protein [bacterium]